MKHTKFSNLALLFGIVGLMILPGTMQAQSNRPPLPGQRSGLNEQQKRGEGLFLQRCSICHFPKEVKPKTEPSVGPDLSGLLKDDKSGNKQKAVRQYILNGGPNMPGFQYGLEPKEVDDLIAYMKVL